MIPLPQLPEYRDHEHVPPLLPLSFAFVVSYIDIGVIGKRTRYGKLLDNRAVFPRVVGQRYTAEI